MSKIITLDQIKQLAEKVKEEDDALGVQLASVAGQVDDLISSGAEENILEGIKVNGVALDIADKMVDLLIASGDENGTISVNGAAVAITGLQALAYKAKISEDDLEEALKATIAEKATDADVQALTIRVTTLEGDMEEIKVADYQTGAQVQAAIQTAISESGHAHFEKVDVIPSVEEAQENVLYLVMNEETEHYDIYAKVGDKVELLDDTTVDLSAYSTTEQMNAAVAGAIEALNIGDYAKASDLLDAVGRITTLEAALDNYYTKDEVDAKLEGYATDEEAAAVANNAVTQAQATDEEFQGVINEVWTPGEE